MRSRACGRRARGASPPSSARGRAGRRPRGWWPPAAAASATRRSDGVSESGPLSSSRRGRAPATRSSSYASRRVVRPEPLRQGSVPRGAPRGRPARRRPPWRFARPNASSARAELRPAAASDGPGPRPARATPGRRRRERRGGPRAGRPEALDRHGVADPALPGLGYRDRARAAAGAGSGSPCPPRRSSPAAQAHEQARSRLRRRGAAASRARELEGPRGRRRARRRRSGRRSRGSARTPWGRRAPRAQARAISARAASRREPPRRREAGAARHRRSARVRASAASAPPDSHSASTSSAARRGRSRGLAVASASEASAGSARVAQQGQRAGQQGPHSRPLGLGRWLRERPLREEARLARRARREGAAAGGSQGLGHERVARRLHRAGVTGDRQRVGARLGEHPHRAPVGDRAHSRRQARVDGRTHHRVGEAQRAARRKDARGREGIGRPLARPRAQARASRIATAADVSSPSTATAQASACAPLAVVEVHGSHVLREALARRWRNVGARQRAGSVPVAPSPACRHDRPMCSDPASDRALDRNRPCRRAHLRRDPPRLCLRAAASTAGSSWWRCSRPSATPVTGRSRRRTRGSPPSADRV